MILENRRVTVTGGSGFLGRHLVRRFEQAGAEVSVPRSSDYDLVEIESTRRMLSDLRPDVLVHAAADVGGIGYDRLYPADVFFNNVVMSANILRAASERQVDKMVIIGSACAYPGDTTRALREEDLLAGPLHPSVECYGFSKRALYIGAKAFRDQYGLKSIFLQPTNLYGRWDKMDPNESHVVAALVRKFVETRASGQGEVVVWGTGRPVREFLYVEDAAEAVFLATESYDKADPLNIGIGVGTSIRELVELLVDITGFNGKVVWDTTKPDGVMGKVLDVSRMKAELQWVPSTSLREGLRKTLEWYERETLAVSDAR